VTAGVAALAGRLWAWMPRQVAASGLLSVLVVAAEALGVVVLARLLTLLDAGADAGGAGALASVVDRVLGSAGIGATAGAVLGAYVLVTVATALLQRSATLVSNRIQQLAAQHARVSLYRALSGARWLPVARLPGAELLSGLTGESDRVGMAAANLVGLGVRALLIVVYLALALRVSPELTLVAFASGALLVLVLRGRRVAARRAGEEGSRVAERLVAAASEHLGGLKEIKSHGGEAAREREFAAVSRTAVETRLRAWRAYADAQALFASGSALLLGAVAYVALEGLRVSAAGVLLLVFLFYRLAPRLSQLQMLLQMLAHDLPAWERLRVRIAQLEGEREALVGEDRPVPVREEIRLERVSFSYGDDRSHVIRELDLRIPALSTTAIVGPSGAGKSTIADLVMGLVAPGEGRVLVDGRALDEGWLRAWRSGIGYVSQETILFHDTVLANLLRARPSAGTDEVDEALRTAAADDFVRGLPAGVLTVLGDRGATLSGGERQRLALARALLRRPSLLILDEATSALDAENEQRIRRAIARLHGTVTILLITHRLTVVRGADLIHVVEDGRLVESGSWSTLASRREGRFAGLWREQMGAHAVRDPDTGGPPPSRVRSEPS
jgi:ATP-binding cassette, subfamily C, bacterial